MHEITLHSQRKSIRFRRWSRKNYAVFGSLHRHVTIGRVCKGIADSSLDKARHIVSVEGNGQRVYAMDGVREQDALAQDIGIPLGYVMLRLMGQPVVVEPAGSKAACSRKIQNNCHLSKRNGERIRVASGDRCIRILSPFRFFMYTKIDYDRKIRKES